MTVSSTAEIWTGRPLRDYLLVRHLQEKEIQAERWQSNSALRRAAELASAVLSVGNARQRCSGII